MTARQAPYGWDDPGLPPEYLDARKESDRMAPLHRCADCGAISFAQVGRSWWDSVSYIPGAWAGEWIGDYRVRLMCPNSTKEHRNFVSIDQITATRAKAPTRKRRKKPQDPFDAILSEHDEMARATRKEENR